MSYNFFGGGSTQTPTAQWGVGNAVAGGADNVLGSGAFDFGGNAPADYNTMSAWGTPNTSLATPTPTAGFGSFASSAGGPGGSPGLGGLGMNLPTLQLGLQGLGSIANLYTGLKALGLAKDQFAFQKDMASKNYTNSVASYNTQLSDRANARAAAENQSPASAQAYINANKLA